MTLTELISEVYTLTNRPDLVAQTSLAVRSATLKLHQMDFFYKDLYETGVAFSSAEYLQTIEYRTLLPRYRAFKYLKKTNLAGTEQGVVFSLIIPDNVLDDYQLNRENVCYVAGDAIQIRSSTQLQYVIFGCYINPDVVTATYSSWIALDHPFAIIFEAAASVFKAVGDTEQFAAYTGLALQFATEVRTSGILANGY